MARQNETKQVTNICDTVSAVISIQQPTGELVNTGEETLVSIGRWEWSNNIDVTVNKTATWGQERRKWSIRWWLALLRWHCRPNVWHQHWFLAIHNWDIWATFPNGAVTDKSVIWAFKWKIDELYWSGGWFMEFYQFWVRQLSFGHDLEINRR